MVDIAAIGRRHLSAALSGEMPSVPVNEWLGDDGEPVEIFYKPLTGVEQKQIQEMANKSEVEGVCMGVKVRALNADGSKVFGDVPIVSMLHDFGYSVLLKIFLLMETGVPTGTHGDDSLTEVVGALEKES